MTATFRNLDESREVILKDYQNRFQGCDTSEDSYFYHEGSIAATARMGATAYAKQRYLAMLPDQATGTDLEDLARQHGLARKAATKAYGLTGTVTVTGTGTCLTGTTLTGENGTEFETTADAPWTAPGSVTLYFQSTGTGAKHNVRSGAELTIVSPPAGMEDTLTVGSWPSSYVPARDQETDDELQGRLSVRVGGGAGNSNAAAWWTLCMDEDADTEMADNGHAPPQECYIYDGVRGVFTVEAVPCLQWDGVQKRPSALGAYFTDLEAYVDSIAPLGSDFDAVQFSEQAQSIVVSLDTDIGYGRDWGTASSASLTTAALTHTTTQVFTTAAPSTVSLAAGDHVILHIGTYFYPNVRKVISVNNGGTPYFIVDEPFEDENGNATAPSAAGGQTVRPGGPIAQACVDAMLALFGGMTPSDTSTPVRYPPVSQEHPTDLTHGMISHALLGASDHIWDVDFTTPAATTTATTALLSGGVLVCYIISPTRADDWLSIRFNQLNS